MTLSRLKFQDKVYGIDVTYSKDRQMSTSLPTLEQSNVKKSLMLIVRSIFETSDFLDEEGNGQSESEEKLPDLPLLSEQLLLDELWDMLGECLKELEESHDQHAVLGW